jgi:uncharacterized protein YndB with AHSA1/START domain
MNQTPTQTTITIRHTVAAPRETVFQAWTEPELLARWWWPPRFATTFAIDLRPGGTYSIRSAAQPDGTVLAISGIFREVQPPQRLVYTWRWEGADTDETLVTVVFSENAGQTTIDLTHERFASEGDAANNRLGWQSCLDRLTAIVGE